MHGRRASFCGMVCLVVGLAVSASHVEGGKPAKSRGQAARPKRGAAGNFGPNGNGPNWLQAGGNQAAMAGWAGGGIGVPAGAGAAGVPVGAGGNLNGNANAAAADLQVATASAAVTPATAAAAATSQKPTLGPADAKGLNAAVLQFAESEIGQRVGSGLCWELGVAALAAAGAQPPQGNSYGTAVSLADAKPGDIIVFNAAYFQGANYWMQLGDPIHVAVLEAVSGSQIVILHQNFNGQMFVTRSTLNLGDLKRGTVTFYQPVPR